MADQFNILDAAVPEISSALVTGEETYDRNLVSTNALTMTSQSLRLVYWTARKTAVRTQIKVSCGNTAAGATPSLVRMGVWTASGAGDLLELVASTANDTTLLATQFTDYTKALSASVNIQRGQRYASGLLVVTAATAPQVCGLSPALNTAQLAADPRLMAVITSQADLPSTAAAASLTNTSNRPWFVLL